MCRILTNLLIFMILMILVQKSYPSEYGYYGESLDSHETYYPGESDYSDGFRGSGEPGESGDYGKSVDFGYW